MLFRRIKLGFSRGMVVTFSDRDRALKQIGELAEKGTTLPLVIYGPEGCGKTALLRQAIEILKGYGYSVIYFNPLAERRDEKLITSDDIKELVKGVAEILHPVAAIAAELVVDLASRVLERKRRVAVVLDDVFQAIGLGRAETFVKTLLNMIEYPPSEYESIVALISSSEGITKTRIGRHRWVDMRIMWNMSREGFRELYNQLPSPKPNYEGIWRLTGGNPSMLRELLANEWSVDRVVKSIVYRRGLHILAKKYGNELREVIEDPDYLWSEYPRTENLIKDLIEVNMIVEVWGRDPALWIDEPPPDRDAELGIGKRFAWQTPLHREAARKALEITA